MILLIIILNLSLLVFLLLRNKNSSIFNRHTILRFLLLILFGGIACVISLIIEYFSTFLLISFFSDGYSIVNNKVYWDNSFNEILYNFIFCFIIVGIIEELTKILPVFFYNKRCLFYHNDLKKFDFIIPFLIVGMTFSIIEDVEYIMNGDEWTGFARLITEFCGHTLYALLIGVGYYKSSVKAKATSLSFSLRMKKVPDIKFISGMKSKNIFAVSCIIIIFIHGLYDFLVYTFIDLAFIFIALSLIYFIVFLIMFRNTNFKDDYIKRFLKDNKHLTKEEVECLIDEHEIKI